MNYVSGLPTEVKGPECVWNFPGADGENVTRSVEAAGDTVVVTQGRVRYLLERRSGVVYALGHERRTGAVTYGAPVTLMREHPAFGDSIYSNLSGRGIETVSGWYDGCVSGCRGFVTSVADGRGTVVAGDVKIDSVTRVHIHRELRQVLARRAEAVDAFLAAPADSVATQGQLLTTDIYLWLRDGDAMPLAESVTTTIGADGREHVISTLDLLNLSAPAELADEAEPNGENTAPAGGSPAVSVALSDDGSEVTVNYSNARGKAVIAVSDETGRWTEAKTCLMDESGAVSIPLGWKMRNYVMVTVWIDGCEPIVVKTTRQAQ